MAKQRTKAEMTHRERFRKVLRGERVDRVPMVFRLDLWYNAAVVDGTLPAACRGLTIPQIEAKLGMGRSSRFRGFYKTLFPTAHVTETREGDAVRTAMRIGGRTLTQTFLRTPEQERIGIGGHLSEYYLKSAKDYDAMIAAWEGMRWEFNPEGFATFDREAGPDGLPVLVMNASPIHFMMLAYTGYEAFYLHLADFPDRVEALLRVIERRYEEFWRAVAATPAELLLHGAHWSTAMTPRPIFRRFFLPYFERFTDFMHRAGKTCAFHGDSDLSGLLAEVPASGMDVVDCFACAPLVPLTLPAARRAWKDRVIIWGGVPSTVLMPSCPRAEFKAYLKDFLTEIADGRAVIVAVSDNFMPGSDWDRLVELAEGVAALRPA